MNSVQAGNGVVNTLLHQKRLFISSKCRTFYEKMTSYHRQVKDGIIQEEVAPKQDSHECDSLRCCLYTLEHRNMDYQDNPLSKDPTPETKPNIVPINKTGIYNQRHYA